MAAPSVNILAWIRPEQITVAYAGVPWRLEAHTAAQWLGAIAMDFEGLSGVFPGLIADEHVDDMAAMINDLQHREPMRDVARKVVEAAGGRDWWWTVNLTRKAIGQWILINGILVRQGVRADSIGLPDWLDACYSWLWERGDDNHRKALDMELAILPRGMRGSKRQIQQMMSDFAAD